MPLRDYQQEGLDKVNQAREEGENKNLLVFPTGAGKAVILSHIPEALGMEPSEQMLVVVHRNELASQLSDKLAQYNPDLKVDIERAQYRADDDANVIVASIQTIGRAAGEQPGSDYCDRLTKFDPDRIRHVVVDEVHHCCLGGDYDRVLRYAGVYKPDLLYDDPTKTLTGFTATPNRSDNIGLEAYFNRIAASRDLKTMMSTGITVDGVLRTWLCDLKAYRVSTEIDLSEVGTAKGDFITKQLEKKVNTPERNNLIVDKYLEYGENNLAFAFSVDIQHSEDLAAMFEKRGIRAVAISSKTGEEERKRIYRAFKDRVIRVLVSCGVLTEGIDIPEVGCLLMARPTKSRLLYQQMAGRGFRPFPSPEALADYSERRIIAPWIKPYCVVLDFADMSGKHQLNTVPSLFGLSAQFNVKGKSVRETVEEIEKAKTKAPAINLTLYNDLESVKGIVERVDLFGKPVIPEEVKQNSSLSWVTGVTAGTYQLCLPDKGMFTVKVNALGQFEVYRHVLGVRSPMGVKASLKDAFTVAEREVPRDALQVLMADAKWRFDTPSEKQISTLAKLYPEMRRSFPSGDQGYKEFVGFVNNKYSKGEASTLISQRIGTARPNYQQWKPKFSSQPKGR